MAVNDILQQLRAEHESLALKRAKLKHATKENEDDLKRIETAMSALGEKPANRKSSKKAATKSDVIDALELALQQHSPSSHDDLLELAKAAIAGSGKSLQGFALRFKEALRDARFIDTTEGYRLHVAEASETDQHTQ